LGALLLAIPAAAADPLEPEVFRLDAVFVSVFRTPDEALSERARAIERGLVDKLQERHLVVPLERVAGFDDYSAETYLLACPQDRWDGCAYVIGDRGRADWAVSGVVTREVETGLMVQTSIIDVKGSRTVVQFAVTVPDDDQESYAEAVASFIDRLSAGERTPESAEVDPALEAQKRRLEKEAIAQGLAALEEELGALDISEEGFDLDAPRLTDADLQRYRDRDSVTPWESLGMTAAQYKRMRNRGMDVQSFRARLKGRQGKVLVRGSLMAGGGPNQVNTDLRWAIDASNGQVVRTEVFQEVVGGWSFGAMGEAGLGVLPWLDVSVFATTEVGSIRWVLHPETVQDPRVPDEPVVQPVGAVAVGGRATVALFPDLEVHPTVGGGVALWFGPGLFRVVDPASVPQANFPDPAQVLVVHAGPGVELEASKEISLFARLELGVPIAGSGLVRETSGDASLQYPGTPLGSSGVGVRGAAGIQVAFGPLWGKADDRRRPGYTGAP